MESEPALSEVIRIVDDESWQVGFAFGVCYNAEAFVFVYNNVAVFDGVVQGRLVAEALAPTGADPQTKEVVVRYVKFLELSLCLVGHGDHDLLGYGTHVFERSEYDRNSQE